jgi:hypothetical protein
MSDVLRRLIEKASDAAERTFLSTGSFPPMWHMMTAEGDDLFIGATLADKNMAVALIKAMMILHNVVRYVFIDEAWLLDRSGAVDPAELKRLNRDGLEHHPERQEVLMFMAEDQSAGALTGRRAIIRAPGRKARLGPLIIDRDLLASEGRMVGLLPPVGARQ